MERLAVAIMRFGFRLLPHREKGFIVVRRNKLDNAWRAETRMNLTPEVAEFALEAWAATAKEARDA